MVTKRLRNFALAGVLGGLGLSACKNSNGTAAEVAPPENEPAKVGVTVAEVPEVPKASADARAKALGYAKYLPLDTQAYFGIYDGKGFVKDILASKAGSYAQKMASEMGDVNLDDMTEDPQMGMGLSIMAEEFFLAIGAGAGGESRAPLGVAVVGGMAFSTLLTFFIVPATYVSLERAREFVRRRSRSTGGAVGVPVERAT
jgi:hypothetical protein